MPGERDAGRVWRAALVAACSHEDGFEVRLSEVEEVPAGAAAAAEAASKLARWRRPLDRFAVHHFAFCLVSCLGEEALAPLLALTALPEGVHRNACREAGELVLWHCHHHPSDAAEARVRIAAPLGPLVPTERPLDDTNLPLPWRQPGALQGDDEQDDEVEKDYPDVRLSRNSRLVPEGQRETKFCMLCHKPREAERRNFCPKCLVQDTLIPMRHVIVRAIALCPLDFDGNPIMNSDLMWNIAREITRLTIMNRNECIKLEPPDEPPI